MRVSERGQLTIPQELPERYGLLANTEVELVPDGIGACLTGHPESFRGKGSGEIPSPVSELVLAFWDRVLPGAPPTASSAASGESAAARAASA